MTTAKEALLAAGRIKAITRGRISNDNHAWLKSQHDAGVRFSDWPKGKVEVTAVPKSDGKTITRVKRAPVQGKDIVEFNIRYDPTLYRAVRTDTGKALTGRDNGLREVCNSCKVSLVQCHCGKPTILGNIPIRIEYLK